MKVKQDSANKYLIFDFLSLCSFVQRRMILCFEYSEKPDNVKFKEQNSKHKKRNVYSKVYSFKDMANLEGEIKDDY